MMMMMMTYLRSFVTFGDVIRLMSRLRTRRLRSVAHGGIRAIIVAFALHLLPRGDELAI